VGESASAEAAPAAEVPEQLAFTATDVATGASVEGSSLAGKDLILWFWAPWCPNCQAEAPDVAAAAAALPEGVTLVGIPGRADVASSQEFLGDYGVEGFAHLYDEDGSIWQAFGVAYQPAFALVNDDGSIETIPGSLGEDGILAAAQDLASR
jgi:thiol-disulfide isomerase/thioredoxin